MAIQSAWFKDCPTEEARAQRKEEIRGYSRAFEALSKVLTEKKPSDREYDANWFHRQIALNEYNAAIKELKLLLETE